MWSAEILTELDRTLRLLLAKRGASADEVDAYLTRLFRQMRITFPDALVTEWEEFVPTIHLPDPDDRHVVAAAQAGRADVIVTDNLADFPPTALPASITRQSLDDFLLDIFDIHPGSAVTAIRAIAARSGKSGPKMNHGRGRHLPVHARHAALRRTTTSGTDRRALAKIATGQGIPLVGIPVLCAGFAAAPAPQTLADGVVPITNCV